MWADDHLSSYRLSVLRREAAAQAKKDPLRSDLFYLFSAFIQLVPDDLRQLLASLRRATCPTAVLPPERCDMPRHGAIIGSSLCSAPRKSRSRRSRMRFLDEVRSVRVGRDRHTQFANMTTAIPQIGDFQHAP